MSRPSTESDVFRAIADPNRRVLLSLLAQKPQPVNKLLEHLSISQPALSQHLKVLREAGLVSTRPEGRERIYSIEAAPLKEVVDWVMEYEKFWKEKFIALGKHLEKKHGKRPPTPSTRKKN